MKYIISALLSVALIWLTPQATPINNQVHANKQTVSAAAPEKVALSSSEIPNNSKITAKTVNAPVQSEQPKQQQPVKPVSVAVEPPETEEEAKAFIYLKESGNNPKAQNSIGCYGIGQDCNGIVKNKCGASYECQDAFFTEYAKRRYGSFVKAKEFWLARVPINGKDYGHWW